jgi:hypothetical protein
MKVNPLVFTALFAALSSGSIAADSAHIASNVRALNEQSIKLLGLSLYELRYLISIEPNTYYDLANIDLTFDTAVLGRLEAKGYVRTERRSLPGGGNDPFLRVIPIHAGAEIRRSVNSLQHNNALQPTR